MSILGFILFLIHLGWFLTSANVCSSFQLDCPRYYRHVSAQTNKLYGVHLSFFFSILPSIYCGKIRNLNTSYRSPTNDYSEVPDIFLKN